MNAVCVFPTHKTQSTRLLFTQLTHNLNIKIKSDRTRDRELLRNVSRVSRPRLLVLCTNTLWSKILKHHYTTVEIHVFNGYKAVVLRAT